MNSPCPNCRSWSVRQDRSLGGRAVCGACGTPLDGRGGRWRQPSKPLIRKSLRPFVIQRRRSLPWRWLWVLVLVGLPVAATFAFDKGWLRVPRPMAPGEWPVKTSADVELLLRQAQHSPSADDAADLTLVRQLIATLLAHHVAIVVTDAVPSGAAAAWNAMAAEISIRPSVLGRGLPVLAEVLAHEAAHVAQSCSAGGLRRASRPMGIPVDPAVTYDSQLNSGLYPGHPSGKAVELEAYSVGARPAWAAQLMDHYCS